MVLLLVIFVCSFHYPSSTNLMSLYSSLGKLPAFTRPKIDWLVKFFYGLWIFCMHALSRPLARRVYLRFLPHPLIRRRRLRFIFFTLSLLRKAYRHYILVSKEFTRLGLLAFLWINKAIWKLGIHTSLCT